MPLGATTFMNLKLMAFQTRRLWKKPSCGAVTIKPRHGIFTWNAMNLWHLRTLFRGRFDNAELMLGPNGLRGPF